jgi:hypothetical protein
MNHLKPLRINEEMTHKELAEDIKDANFIEISYLGGGKKWGVVYWKNKEKFEEGMFNSRDEVNRFLEEIEVNYQGKEGYAMMKKIRDKEIAKVPYPGYQRELLDNGLDDFEF